MKSKLFSIVAKTLVLGAVGYSQHSMTINNPKDQLSPAEIFARCYAKLVRKPVMSNDETLIALRSGSYSDAESACSLLLSRANLGANGVLANPRDTLARDILTTMQMVHNSWFTSQSIILLEAVPENKLVLDLDEPGLYWTRALFKTGETADSVLKYGKSLKSVRRRDSEDVSLTHFQARSFFSYVSRITGVDNRNPLFRVAFMNDIKLAADDGANYSFLDIPDAQLSQFGEMIGISDQNPLRIGRLMIPSVGHTATNTLLRDPTQGPNLNVDLHRHFGGGVMGSVMYGLKNTNLVGNDIPRDYTIIDRRFASRVFQDFLCYQLPVLNANDVDVVPNSNFPFQQSKSCMQCHATMDELALIQRNFIWARSSALPGNFKILSPPDPAREPKGAQVLTRFQLPISTDAGAPFALQEPRGRLHFRTRSGTLVDLPITNFAEVGNALASQDDFYSCAAKRYYSYFTGIDVVLEAEPANELEREHLEFVKKLGFQLKEDKSLRKVIESIFKSETFQSRNYKTEGDAQ